MTVSVFAPMCAPMSGGPAEAGAVPLPGRLALASEAFSGAIDYLMPRARTDYLDVAQHELAPLVNGFYLGDPAADDLVAAIRTSRGRARAQFDQALEHGIDTVPDPLPEVSKFLATVDEIPDWIDEELVEAGVRALRRIDAVTFLGAGWVLGFLLAAIVPNSSRSMACNARAVRDAGQRFAETGRITLDMFDLGGRGRFGAGTRSSSRLRVLHAAVRAQLRHRGDWDESVYGVPISATDLLMAALMPGASALAAQRAGYRFSPRELAGIAHFSGLFAYRQGSPAELIPSTFGGQTKALYFALRAARGQVDPESTDRLMPALVDIEIPGLAGLAQRAVRAVFNGYARRIFGPALCAATGIPDTPVRRLIPLGGALIRPFEVARCRLHVLDLAAHSGADLMWRQLMPRLLSDRADYGWSHVDKVVKA